MAKNYLEKNELYIEIILSKGQGKLTRKAEKLIELIAKNMIKKELYLRLSEDDRADLYQEGLYDMLLKWHGFNEDKYDNALAYLSEIFKRAATRMFNDFYKKKGDSSIRLISIQSSNDGNGLHSI